jgi:hypothetical protein
MAFGRRVLRCAVMRPGHRAPWGLSLLAGVLIAIFLAQSFLAGTIKSPVFDETGDIAAGLSYVQSGEIRANLQHPPLLKELAGVALWLAGVRLPETPQVRQMLTDGGGERSVGSQFDCRQRSRPNHAPGQASLPTAGRSPRRAALSLGPSIIGRTTGARRAFSLYPGSHHFGTWLPRHHGRRTRGIHGALPVCPVALSGAPQCPAPDRLRRCHWA